MASATVVMAEEEFDVLVELERGTDLDACVL
jgi:hypothetical protein